jgi:hypothetical protein
VSGVSLHGVGYHQLLLPVGVGLLWRECLSILWTELDSRVIRDWGGCKWC